MMAPRCVLRPTVLRPLDGVPYLGDDVGLGDHEYVQFLLSGLPSPAEFPEPGGNAEIMKAAAGGLSGTGEALQQRVYQCGELVPQERMQQRTDGHVDDAQGSSLLMNERPSLHQPLLQTWLSSGGVPRALGGDDLLNRFLARGFRGNLAEIRRMGPGAWHPLTPSWVHSSSLERVV